jgi:aerobic carbon-monoxide dehydrogenase medium subunit
VIPRFALVRPGTLQAALEAHADAGGDAAWYAGGTELLQVMKMGLAHFGTLIDLKPISSLSGVRLDPDGALRIGGTTTHREVERSAVVRRAAPALATLERRLANARVRNTGTIGGNLAFAEPHSDPATFLMACGAHVALAGPAGTRTVPLEEFVIGPFATVREPDEILTEVVIPRARPNEGRGYAREAFLERPAVSVAVRLLVDAGAIVEAYVVIGSATDLPTSIPGVANALVGAPSDDAGFTHGLARGAERLRTDIDAIDDINGSADYKLALAEVLLADAARSALREAKGDA